MPVSEREYILTTNLAYIRAASAVMERVVSMRGLDVSPADGIGLTELRRTLARWEIALESELAKAVLLPAPPEEYRGH